MTLKRGGLFQEKYCLSEQLSCGAPVSDLAISHCSKTDWPGWRPALRFGIEYMTAFGFGTFPMMLAISLGGKLVPIGFRLKLQRVTPAVIFLIAVLLIVRGLALGIPYLSPDLASGASCCRK